MAMREPTYLILASLTEGPTHGYSIIAKAEAISGGRVKLAVATLYGALDRLLSEGLIEVMKEEIVDGRARRTYNLTDDGRFTVVNEAQRLSQLANAVLQPVPTKQQPVFARMGLTG
jgi:PadR family transcriptional regulator, regulatory protein PadR